MKHFDFSSTPITKLESLSKLYGCNVLMKRDDLFEYGGGGSKARMLQYILYKAKSVNANYILTAGGPFSNFNRALALMAEKHNLKMRLVLYDKNKHINKYSLNRRLLDLCNVEIVECEPENVIEQIEIETEGLKRAGFKTFYIWGGGKSIEGVTAYKDAYDEILKTLTPDYIFTALGTGTTFSGLLIGNSCKYEKLEIIGISVARSKAMAADTVLQILNDYNSSLDMLKCNGKIVDDYLLGGYGCVNEELESFIKIFIQQEGIIVDSIYVGKALFGMCQHIEKYKSEITGKNIVFLNTGGLYNF